MAQKRKPLNGEYSAKLKAIRSFVSFDYDLRKPLHSAQKHKINRYFDAINDIQARPNKVYRSRNKRRVRTVQEFGRNGFESLPDIKVAFYESSNANPVDLRFDEKGNLHAHGQYFDIRYVPFNRLALLQDADAEISRALNDPGARGADWFRVAVGKDGQYSIASPRKRRNVSRFVKELMTRYSEGGDMYRPSPTGGNHWDRWLHGLLPMTMKNQTEVDQFLRRDAKVKEHHKKQRKQQRRKINNAKKD